MQLVQALAAPREMVAFFCAGSLQSRTHARLTRHQRLAAVERLRADLAGVVHAHERGRFASIGLRKRVRFIGRRNETRRAAGARERPQRLIGGDQELVDEREGHRAKRKGAALRRALHSAS
jgi:hypothetical protein